MLKQVIANLSTQDKKQLLCALESGIAQFIELEDAMFIGVNVEGLKQLTILESIGAWSYGERNNSQSP